MSHKANFIAGKKDLLDEGTRAKIDHWVAKFPPENKRSAVIQALIAAQDQNGGWVDRNMIEAVADYLELPLVTAGDDIVHVTRFLKNGNGSYTAHDVIEELLSGTTV